MRRLIYRRAATDDLRSIARYTKAHWGKEQAAAYAALLRSHIKSLREFPFRFPEVEERSGMRRMGAGHHVVFYVVHDEAVEIVRVLHEAMDYPSRLR